jgi:hypothetical protein
MCISRKIASEMNSPDAAMPARTIVEVATMIKTLASAAVAENAVTTAPATTASAGNRSLLATRLASEDQAKRTVSGAVKYVAPINELITSPEATTPAS